MADASSSQSHGDQKSNQEVNAFWFRRDLRLYDNAGLHAALSSGRPVVAFFIFDTTILSKLEDRDDSRVEFIHRTICEMNEALEKKGSRLEIFHGTPEECIVDLLARFSVKELYANHDYEPRAIERDEKIGKLLDNHDVKFKTHKDQVIFERGEVQKEAGGPYTVFTPYSKKWLSQLEPAHLKSFDCSEEVGHYFKLAPKRPPKLDELGFRPGGLEFPPAVIDMAKLKSYGELRDFPAVPGTTRLGIHLRFGTMSIRELVKAARKTSPVFLKELIWREFFMQVLWSFPHVVNAPFRPEYGEIKWRNDEDDFRAWIEGRTGYPIVDAGMRELNALGFMHNRVRMIAGSFLVKHLLIDWRWGEEYFARKLLDFELSSNNGNWQWVAGCGCDAAPYFRVFNPELQAKRFDPEGEYIRHWVPEIGTKDYPEPIVEAKMARVRALSVYKAGLSRKAPKSSRN